ncbi:MAG: tRNA preQ1(34) S-adenosylmethionine ribosyltransferase-isomerase QueA [Gemmatimonadota bacterium]
MDLSLTASYDYELPDGLIARYPAEHRDGSRLLAVPRMDVAAGGSGGVAPVRHLGFPDLADLLEPGDLLVLNESRVLPFRLLGRKPTGAPAEILLLRPARVEGPASGDDPLLWEALVRPGSKLKPGRRVRVSPQLEVAILDGLEGGGRLVRLETALPLEEALDRFGTVPLPPYLEREEEPLDRERYQTVFAREPGSVAAPTAGLHFTPELLERIAAEGVGIARVVLHVGPGTFRPVECEEIGAHEMHGEFWEVPPEAAEAVARTREGGGRVWAVGTTVVRTLESAAAPGGELRAGRGETRLFISPGYRFRVVDALVTNFHLPRSTLLMLVAALAGHANVMAAYRAAIEERYRFYSYGDAMAVLPRPEPA